jgi:hypothetical protein
LNRAGQHRAALLLSNANSHGMRLDFRSSIWIWLAGKEAPATAGKAQHLAIGSVLRTARRELFYYWANFVIFFVAQEKRRPIQIMVSWMPNSSPA